MRSWTRHILYISAISGSLGLHSYFSWKTPYALIFGIITFIDIGVDVYRFRAQLWKGRKSDVSAGESKTN